MFDLNRLRATADETLGGLVADDAMKHRIYQKAQTAMDARASKPARFWRIAAPALSFALILTLALSLRQPAPVPEEPELAGIRYQIAGHGDTDTPSVNDPLSGAMLASGDTAAQEGLWLSGTNDAPLVLVNGRAYRMLNQTADPAVLDAASGQIMEYTAEPALSTTRDAVSNIAPAGSAVRSVKGMGSMLIAVEFGGEAHLFQRVSYNGASLIGSDTLADTLLIEGHSVEMTLDGVGTVSDAQKLADLSATLIGGAVSESSAGLQNPDGYLVIRLDNGISVQLAVDGERFSACGTWSNPDFFEQFRAAAQGN